MNYFLAPRSGEKSYKNFQSTIKNGVPFDRIKAHLNGEGRRLLAQEDVIYAWGNREGTKTQWDRMQTGDQVIFYAKKELVMVGEVYFKYNNPALALAMWPPDENGKPWEYTFFLKNLRYIKIPIKAFNAIAGFDPAFIVQGFIQIKSERLELIDRQYGSIEQLIQTFESSESNEAPGETEKLYVNINQDLQPVIRYDVSLKPKHVVVVDETRITRKSKIDYVKKNRNNAITGSKGEVLALEYEKRRLLEAGRKDLSAKVERVSMDDDSLGYDVLSFEVDGKERYIEVKSSGAKTSEIRFYLTANEMIKGKALPNYYVYYVDGVSSYDPRITLIEDPLDENKFAIKPDTYIFEASIE